jgi:hypothetical protein
MGHYPDMRWRLWTHEARRAGWPVLCAPLFCAALVALITAAVGRAGAVPAGLGDLEEMGVPLAVGVGVTTLVGRDPVLEVQLALPTAYRATVARRAAAVFAAGVLVAVAADVVLRLGWSAAHGVAAGQLVWFAPAAALAAWGLLAAALLREPAAAAAVVACTWLFERVGADRVPGVVYLFDSTDPRPGSWPVNRIVLLALAAGAGLCGWLALGRTAALLRAGGAR